MKTILITGASSGIGKASAETFADRGWNVVATMRDPAAGADLARRDRVLVAALDVRRPETIAAAVEAGIERFGGIDTLLNNAGSNVPGAFEEIPAERTRDIFEVNVLGVMDVTRAILPHFRARKGGTIVNVSSPAGIVGLPLNSLYTATKFALEGFSESLAFELLAQNIVVKLVEPGLVRTNMTVGWLGSLAATEPIADYADYVAATVAHYEAMIAGGDAPETSMDEAPAVAQRIFEAATDGTDRLRYLVTAGAEALVGMRRDLPEEEYVRTVRSLFAA